MADSDFYRPPLPDLITQLRNDILARFQSDDLLRRADAEVYSRAVAAATNSLYGYIDYLARNMLPDLCDEAWLYRHGKMKRCPRKPAQAAVGFVRWDNVSGTPSIQAGTQIQRDDQETYTTTAAAQAVNDVLRVPVTADEPGVAGNTDDGIAMRLISPISGLSSTGYADTVQGGADIEDLEVWRGRVMERWFYTPQGGADPDYVIWAKEVPGITRAWTKRNWQGVGTVGVMLATGDPTNPAPDDTLVQQVWDHIFPLAPVAGNGLFTFAATENVIPMTIALAKDTDEIRASVVAELNSLMLRDGVPDGLLYYSHISEAISVAAGEVAHKLIVPAGDVQMGDTDLPVVGTITWANYDSSEA